LEQGLNHTKVNYESFQPAVQDAQQSSYGGSTHDADPAVHYRSYRQTSAERPGP